MDNKTIELHTIATFQGKEYELENLLNGLLNKLEEKDKEIERLKNKLIEMTEIATRKENILLELEKWITFSDTESFNPALNYDDECKMEYIYVDDLKDKLKELKEGK